jgi:hypothetical protein
MNKPPQTTPTNAHGPGSRARQRRSRRLHPVQWSTIIARVVCSAAAVRIPSSPTSLARSPPTVTHSSRAPPQTPNQTLAAVSGHGSSPPAALLVGRRGAQDPPGRLLHPGCLRAVRAPAPRRGGPGTIGAAEAGHGVASGVRRLLPGAPFPCHDPSPAPCRPPRPGPTPPGGGRRRPRHFCARAFVPAPRHRVRDRRRRLLVTRSFCCGARYSIKS